VKPITVTTTITLTAEMGEYDIIGTGLQGYLPEGTRYCDIVRVFGKPQLFDSIDGKIKAEWTGRINGLVFTIYDYKSPAEPKQNTDWHIGGKTAVTADMVNSYFESVRGRLKKY